jgi:uncharacterized membrane-anchored protein YitT (DUF2179 family)
LRAELPPARYWIAILLQAVEIRFLEKASAVSSGGLTGISIGLAHLLGVPVGAVTLVARAAILLVVWRSIGQRAALGSLLAGFASSACLWACELVPFHPLPMVLAFPLILVLSYLPSSLLLSIGYSFGGFSAVAQVLERLRIPVGVTIFGMNGLSLLLMTIAYGRVSGLLSLVATLLGGLGSQLWLNLFRRYPPPTPAHVQRSA